MAESRHVLQDLEETLPVTFLNVKCATWSYRELHYEYHHSGPQRPHADISRNKNRMTPRKPQQQIFFPLQYPKKKKKENEIYIIHFKLIHISKYLFSDNFTDFSSIIFRHMCSFVPIRQITKNHC